MSLLLVKILQPLEPTCNNNNKKKKFFNDFDWPVPASFLATPWHRFSKAKKCRQQLLLLQVFCVKLILRSKLHISDLKIWTFLNLEWLCKSLWTFSLMMWFLPTLKGSQPYKVPTQSRSSIHPTLFLKLFVVTDCKFWTDWPVLSASKVFSLTHHHHFKTLWPKKSQLFSRCFMSSWCLFDGVGRLFQDCFLYLLHTQNNDRALQKTFFFLPWMGCWTTKHYGYIL